MRCSVFELFEGSRAGLPAAVLSSMQHILQGIDSESSMGIPDRAREWFVFHMMKQAAANNRSMGGILDGFEKKLEFLAKSDQAECPVCLEAFVADSPTAPETLACCHKVCKE